MATITQRGNSFTARVRRKGVTRTSSFSSRKAAETWARNLENQIDRSAAGLKQNVSKLTLGVLIEEYRDEVKPLKPWGRSKEAALEYLSKALGHVALRSLTKVTILDHAKMRFKEGASPATIAPEISYLGAVLKYGSAVKDYDIDLQAYEEARVNMKTLGIIGRSKHRKRMLKPMERDILRDHFDFVLQGRPNSAPMNDIIDFALETSMRMSEILSLRWDDYDAQMSTIVVRDRKHPQDHERHDDEVALLGDAPAIINRQPRTDERIFPHTAIAVSAAFTRAVAATDIQDLRFHDLRHTAITDLLRRGFVWAEIMTLSGHRDANMISRYTHPTAQHLHGKNAGGFGQ